MNSLWEEIVDCLRAEVTEYGALLHLFEEQQKLLFKRDAAGVVMTSSALEGQVSVVQECRLRREAKVAEFATYHNEPSSATMRALLPLIAREAQPLVSALIADINRLISKVRRVSRQNHLFLSRTIENQVELIRHFRPEGITRTYSPTGRASYTSVREQTALIAEG